MCRFFQEEYQEQYRGYRIKEEEAHTRNQISGILLFYIILL